MSALQCSSDFDKRFIHSALIQWYGSLDEFNVFVRGPLKDEILQTIRLSRVPFHLIILAMSPAVGLQLDVLAGILTAGLSFDYWGRWIFGQILTIDMLTAPWPLLRIFILSFGRGEKQIDVLAPSHLPFTVSHATLSAKPELREDKRQSLFMF